MKHYKLKDDEKDEKELENELKKIESALWICSAVLLAGATWAATGNLIQTLEGGNTIDIALSVVLELGAGALDVAGVSFYKTFRDSKDSKEEMGVPNYESNKIQYINMNHYTSLDINNQSSKQSKQQMRETTKDLNNQEQI